MAASDEESYSPLVAEDEAAAGKPLDAAKTLGNDAADDEENDDQTSAPDENGKPPQVKATNGEAPPAKGINPRKQRAPRAEMIHYAGGASNYHSLVWCQEHACKDKSVERRHDLKQMAARYNLREEFKKKAGKFLSWYEDVCCKRGGRCILFTDWREVKPILEGIDDKGLLLPPIIVLCEDDKVYHRACTWKKTDPHDVYIVDHFRELERIVHSVSAGTGGPVQAPVHFGQDAKRQRTEFPFMHSFAPAPFPGAIGGTAFDEDVLDSQGSSCPSWEAEERREERRRAREVWHRAAYPHQGVAPMKVEPQYGYHHPANHHGLPSSYHTPPPSHAYPPPAPGSAWSLDAIPR